MNYTNLSAYDSFDLHYNPIASFLADFNVCIEDVRNDPRFGFNGAKIYGKKILLNPKDDNKAWVRIDYGFTDKSGNTHPNITVTTKGGTGVGGKFSCWEQFKALNDNNIEPPKFSPRIAPKIAPVAMASNNDDARKRADFEALRDVLPTLPTERGEFAYMVEKFGVYAELVAIQATGLKRGKNKYGEFIAYPLTQEIGDEPCCIQTIGANGFKIIRNAYEGAKVGAFYVIGNIRHAHKGIQFVEGLATALTARYATGLVTVVCLDAGNLPVVVKKFSEWGYKNLIVCPDNDIKPDKPNTGLIAAFKAVQGIPSASVQVPQLDGLKCDFNDIHKAKGIDEVRRQLHKNNALLFENGTLYVNKQKTKSAIERAEYERAFLAFIMQVLPEQRESSRAKIIGGLVENCPRHYSLETACFKAEKILIHERNKEQLHLEIRRAYELKKQSVKLRNSLTEADLRGLYKLDLANPQDVIKLHNIARYERATFIDFRGMGSGKTELNNEIIQNDLDGLSSFQVVPRVSLSYNISNTFKTAHYKSVGREKSPVGTYPVLTSCVNSMVQFKPEKEFNHGFFDEMSLDLESVLAGATMKNNLEVFNCMTAFIKNSRLSVFSDADLNALTLDYIRNAAPDKPIYYIVDSRPRKYLLPFVIYRGGSLDNLRIECADRITNGQKLYICTDSIAEVTKTVNFLKSKGIKEHRILFIHAKNKGDSQVKAFLENPNEEAKKYDAVIVSPVIQCGFSICNGWFDAVIGLLGSGACTSNEIAQSLYRVRDAKEIVIAVTPQKNRNRVMSLNLFLDGEINTRHRISENGELIVELDDLSKRHYRALAQRNADLNDLENSILLHLENIGFEVRHDIPAPASVEKIDGLTEAVKAEQAAEIKKARSITSSEFVTLSANQNLTSEESNVYDRHMVESMAGVEAHTDAQLEQLNNQHDDVITDDDITNYQSGMLSRIQNRELMLVDVEELKEHDRENHHKGKRHRRKTVVRMLIDKLVDAVDQRATDKIFINEKTGVTKARGRAFDKTIAAKICAEVLQDNCADLAANGYADYSKPIERPVQTLRNIFKQYGYNLNCLGRDGDGDRLRWFEIIQDDEVSTYCAKRERNRKTKPVQ